VLYQAAFVSIFTNIPKNHRFTTTPTTKKQNTKKQKKNFENLTINLINGLGNESRLDMGGVTL
jgi:hypothetical protein